MWGSSVYIIHHLRHPLMRALVYIYRCACLRSLAAAAAAGEDAIERRKKRRKKVMEGASRACGGGVVYAG